MELSAPQVMLDYRPVERARRSAASGLRLQGILFSIMVAILFLSAIVPDLGRMGIKDVLSREGMLVLGGFAAVFFLGMLKFLCAWMIARGNRPVAYLALLLVGLECAVCLYVLARVGEMFADPWARQEAWIIGPLMLLVFIGWCAVFFEITQVLRLSRNP